MTDAVTFADQVKADEAKRADLRELEAAEQARSQAIDDCIKVVMEHNHRPHRGLVACVVSELGALRPTEKPLPTCERCGKPKPRVEACFCDLSDDGRG